MGLAATQQLRAATDWRERRRPMLALRRNIEKDFNRRGRLFGGDKHSGVMMPPLLRVILLVFCGSIIAAGPVAAQKADPALFGALPAIDAIEISPDGNTVALLQNANNETVVVFVDLNDPGATPKGVPIGDRKARTIEWVDNDYLLLLVSVAQTGAFLTGLETHELARWISISKDQRKLKVLFERDAGYYVPSPGALLAITPDSPGDAVFARWTPDARVSARAGVSRLNDSKRDIGQGYSLFNVNVGAGREKLTFAGKAETWDWVVDAEGDAVLRVDYDEDRGERKIHRRRSGSKTFEHVTTLDSEFGTPDAISFYGLGEAPNEVLATTYGGQDKFGVVGFDIESGQIARTVFRHPKYDVTGVAYDPRKATAARIYYTDDFPRVFHLNPADQKLQDALAAALPGAEPYLTSRSWDETKIIVHAVYPDRPTDIYIFDKTARKLTYFSSTRPALTEDSYGDKSPYDHVSPDGLEINGYLTTPPGAEKRNLPLIVLPHGGPESRDNQAFDWWAHFYAARGYAVYQPNYRGSFGYGLAFREAGYGEWGRKMQDDITNGVKKLIADGIADAERICIVGGSYGGYAALAGATLTPDLYACAVSVNGVTDLMALIGSGADSDMFVDYWEKRIGSRFRDREEVEAVSPAKIAWKARAPIMLIHAKDDTVVPFYQSEVMFNALKGSGRPHEFVELKGEDHWLSNGETRTEMLRRSIDFIDKHIGGE